MSMSTTAAESAMQFPGFLRADGRVGIRNHLALIATVALSNRIAQLAAAQYEATQGTPVLCIAGEFQRGLQTADASLQDQVIAQLVAHPNVGAAVVLCHDRLAAQAWQRRLEGCGKPIEILAVMDSHGVRNAIDRTAAALDRVGQSIRLISRVPCPVSALTLALECGGSDASSAICSNPAVGRFVDWALANGASAIVSETAEFIGGEEIVRSQSTSPEVAAAIIERIAATEARMSSDGDHYRGVNPTAENIEGGLTTLVEKTMGAVCKIGNARFTGCLSFGESPDSSGLYFMDTPFFSPCSITGMVAGGAQLTLFSMGVFNPSGSTLAPTIKICGNPKTLKYWRDDVDVGLSELIAGKMSLDQACNRIVEAVLGVAGGELTRTEAWGEGQFIVPRSLPTF